jgi:hypothetical protein
MSLTLPIYPFILGLSLTCSLSFDFIYPTLEENFNNSGAAILGEVKPRENSKSRESEITLIKAQYFKGCGPSEIKIKGYSDGALCSIMAPEGGSKVIVFVCKTEEEGVWRLNTYRPFTGQLGVRKRHLVRLNELRGGLVCGNEGYYAEPCKSYFPSSEDSIESDGNDSEISFELSDSLDSENESDDDDDNFDGDEEDSVNVNDEFESEHSEESEDEFESELSEESEDEFDDDGDDVSEKENGRESFMLVVIT